MTIPKGQSWPRVKRTCTSGSKLPSCVADMHLFQTHGAHHGQPWFPLMPVLWDTTIWVCPRTTWQPKPWPTGWCDHHGLLHKFNNSRVLPKGPYPPCLRMADRALLQDTLELWYLWKSQLMNCRLPQLLIWTGGHWGLYKNSTRKIWSESPKDLCWGWCSSQCT